jgi:hypothetical protein
MTADVVVIGAGASGMMAAAAAAEQGATVILADKNRKAGRKLRITGKGRCNLTNDCEVKEVLAQIPGDGRFLYSSLTAFPPQAVMRFFRENGLALKTERGRRVFPCSDNANDVADLLLSLCRKRGVRVLCDRVTEIIVREGAVRGVRTGTEEIACRACIVCTGGLSYPLTGSTGDGYRFAEALGHTVTPPRPSLVPLVCAEDSCERMQGLSLKNVELRVYEDDRLLCREQGEMLFTHFGVSGPLVLSASARMFRSGEPSNPHTLSGSKHADNAKNHRPSVSNGFEASTGPCYRLEIDMKPALDEKTLDQRLLRDFAKYQNRNLSNALVDLLPHTMIPEVIAAAGVPPELPVHSLTREMRQSLLKTVKSFPLTIVGTRPIDEAIVTAGGVRTAEINPRSMQSRKVSGLFFAGEVLDLDAYTGGYNLQIAWSTGRMAGMRASEYALSE